MPTPPPTADTGTPRPGPSFFSEALHFARRVAKWLWSPPEELT
jgi:hypothetical protein